MKRDWDKYRHTNITCGDCQLMTAVNAYHYLTGKVITDRRYERLIDLCGCRYGSAITIEKVWKDLGIREKKRHEWLTFIGNRGELLRLDIAELLPLEISVWHKFFGFHSILAVEFEPRTRAFRIVGLKHVTSMDGWIFEEDLNPLMILNPGLEKPRWRCRSFELAKKRRVG